jgi:hypothetical protein
MGLEPTNLLTASQALYQLSYAPEVGKATGHERRVQQLNLPTWPDAAILQPDPDFRVSTLPDARAGSSRRVTAVGSSVTPEVWSGAAWSTTRLDRRTSRPKAIRGPHAGARHHRATLLPDMPADQGQGKAALRTSPTLV